MPKTVSIVIPTHNRSGLVFEKVKRLLVSEYVKEIIVVADGCEDSTVCLLSTIRDIRLRVIVNSDALGPPAARNRGSAYATGEWIAFLDDDDLHSPDFVETLVGVGEEADAGVVGAPWLHLKTGENPKFEFERLDRTLDGPTVKNVGAVPQSLWVPTVWIANNVVVRRDILAEVGFDEMYRGNFWREETDFFVAVARLGYRVVCTNLAYSYLHERTSGGISRASRLGYEWWIVRNNARFIRKHGRWLFEQGYIALPPITFLLDQAIQRVLYHLRPRLGLRS